jgi:hypothetical protein
MARLKRMNNDNPDYAHIFILQDYRQCVSHLCMLGATSKIWYMIIRALYKNMFAVLQGHQYNPHDFRSPAYEKWKPFDDPRFKASYHSRNRNPNAPIISYVAAVRQFLWTKLAWSAVLKRPRMTLEEELDYECGIDLSRPPVPLAKIDAREEASATAARRTISRPAASGGLRQKLHAGQPLAGSAEYEANRNPCVNGFIESMKARRLPLLHLSYDRSSVLQITSRH